MSDLKRYQREDAGNLGESYDFLKGRVGQAKRGLPRSLGILDWYRKGLGKVFSGGGNVGQVGSGVEGYSPGGGWFPGGIGEESGENSRMIQKRLGRDGAGFIADAYEEYMRAGNTGSMGKDFDGWLLGYAREKGVIE